MSFTFNRVTLVARAAGNPEMRLTNGGQRVATLNLATDRPGRAGATSITDWHRVICWDKLAEIAAEHITKGRLVFVEGAVTYRTWQDQQSQKHTTTEILARELILLDRPLSPTSTPASSNRRSSANSAADGEEVAL
jgi:single-strand DNA-binding protein